MTASVLPLRESVYNVACNKMAMHFEMVSKFDAGLPEARRMKLKVKNLSFMLQKC